MGKILIVEDNPANMRLVVAILHKSGYATLQAEHALAGIELARREQPDLILMDVQLPGMDGLDATAILKADPATQDIPVYALTAFTMNGDKERFIRAGCDGYIPKPIRYKEILEVIESVLMAVR